MTHIRRRNPATACAVHGLALLACICCATNTNAEENIDTKYDAVVKQWQAQQAEIKTAQISFRYFVSANHDVAYEEMGTIIDEVVRQESASSEDIRALFAERLNLKVPPWREGVLVIDGPKYRETYMWNSDEARYRDAVHETVFDGSIEAMYWPESEQVTLSTRDTSRWSHLKRGSVRFVPPGRLKDADLRQCPNGLLVVSKEGAGRSTELHVDPSNAAVHWYRNSAAKGRYISDTRQVEWSKFDDVWLPKCNIRTSARDGKLYDVSVFIVTNAIINAEITDDFHLAIPAGTTVADRRSDTESRRALRLKEPTNDIVRWLIDNDPPAPR